MAHSFEVALLRSRDAIYANQQLLNSFEHLYIHLASLQKQLDDVNEKTEGEIVSHTKFHHVAQGFMKSISEIDTVLSEKIIHENGVRGIVQDFNSALSDMDNTEHWRAIKWVVTYLIDFTLPILIAALAIYLGYENALYVLSKVFDYVWKAA